MPYDSQELKRKMDILIVEDDYISRALLKKTLNSMGYQVVEAENGKQAWQIMQQQPRQLVISDWMMPEMDGLALCRQIRATAFNRYIYIIMLTAKDLKDDLVNVFQSGADDYIPKPFDIDELRARIMTGIRVVELEERYKGLQQILIESRNKLQIVFDSLQEEILAVDDKFIVTSVNKAYAEASGLLPSEIVGKGLPKISPKQQSMGVSTDEIAPLMVQVFQGKEIERKVWRGTDSAGGLIFKQVTCLPIRNQDNHIYQTLLVMKDITEERRKTEEIEALNGRLIESAEQLEAKNKKLETTLKRLEETQTQMLQSEKMASIGQLAAGVAHEINNPTGFVSSNLKTLNDYQTDIGTLVQKYRGLLSGLESPDTLERLPLEIRAEIDAVKQLQQDIDIDYVMNDIGDLIDDCRDGTERIKKIVIDLKDFAHPGEGQIQSADINKGLESTLNVVNNELKYKATVVKEFGSIPNVLGNPQQLNQVFMNILVNAAQAIEKMGEIRVKTSTNAGMVEVMISDTGCGIPAENLNKIFDPFFTTKEVGKGTGLGMNIAYNIVKKHNGSINVQSKVGEGTTFTVKLPAEA